MSFENKTQFQTRDLKRIYTKVSNAVPVPLPAKVIVQTSKTYSSSTWDPRQRVQPLGLWLYREPSPLEVAILFDEALRLGRSKDPRNLEELGYVTSRLSWAADYPLRIKNPKVVTKNDKLQKRLKELQKHIKNWKRKQKLADTKINNYSKEIKSLEKKIAKANEPYNVCTG
jgi:hypothetical protein